ncbi:gamma carbonic anhydrase family protein [Roseburia hominis]
MFCKNNIKIAETANVVKEAVLLGDVTIEEEATVLCYSALRGDHNRIVVGRGSNIQENCTIHVADDYPVIIGEGVTVGHNVILHGCRIGDHSLIGMGAILMDGVQIGRNCLIAAGSLLTKHTIVPDGSLVLGSPAKVKRELTEEEKAELVRSGLHYKKVGLYMRENGLTR